MAIEGNDLFTPLDLGEGILHIRMPGRTPGPGRVFSSLIVGEEKALVIDTGYGIGDYLGYLRGLTDKPLVVVNTHGHIDHASGNSQFGSAWLNPQDWALADWHTSIEMRRQSDGSAGYADLLVDGPWEKLPLEEGQAFDLGGRAVTAHRCAGHTRGSMSFLDSKTKILFTGDNITRRVLLLGPIHSTSLPEFYQTLLETEKLDFDRIAAAHVPYLMPRSWVGRVKRLVRSFDPAKGKPPICFNLAAPGMRPLEFTVGKDFDDPDYCGFVFDASHLEEFLAGGLPEE